MSINLLCLYLYSRVSFNKSCVHHCYSNMSSKEVKGGSLCETNEDEDRGSSNSLPCMSYKEALTTAKVLDFLN